jgi:hypothetical protein
MEGCLPRYYFTIRWADHEDIDPQGTQLADDDAALDHAYRMVRRLQASGGYDDPALVVEVRNEMRERVLSIPFLAGCAQACNDSVAGCRFFRLDFVNLKTNSAGDCCWEKTIEKTILCLPRVQWLAVPAD